MTDLPEVSVVLPTFNRDTYIAESLRSVLNQTLPPKEIVVVDDGSTDGTADVVAAFAPRVRYVRQENAGKLTAIATGMDLTSGDLVWIMDDDDLATPHALEALAAPFARDPEVVLTYGRMTRFADGDSEAADELVDHPTDDRPFLVQMMEDCFVTGHPCVLARRDRLEALRPFDLSVIASVDYYLHLGVAMTGRSEFVDTVVLRQRQHNGLRGPAHARYTEAERNAKWIEHDAYLLRGILETAPLQAYLDSPPWDGRTLDTEERRLALIQKAVIAGRKKLWPEALDALEVAMAILPEVPISEREQMVLTGMLGSRYGIDEVYASPDIPGALRAIIMQRTDREAALTALSRPLLHEMKIARREADPRRAGRAIQCWARLMDLRSTQAALHSALGRNLNRAVSRFRFT
ncbi:MAG: glycosyltransferase family 2 protein [Gemmobacter sp.]|nr:glycosyltransferase family 2 protein [Gemmobacter sp.]